jgi:hypothetical protein
MGYSQFALKGRLTLFVSLIVVFLVAGLALVVSNSQAEALDVGSSSAAPPPGRLPWTAQYFSNPNLKGQPALERSDGQVNFNWGTRAPAPGLPADRFSVRWTQKTHFSEGPYRFCVTADDGVRVEMDDQTPFIRQWHDGVGTYCTDVYVTKGLHKVRVEYYEHLGQAKVHLWWEKLTWKGEYFSNPKLKGQPRVVRDDANVDFNWGTGRPDPDLRADNFSVRWTRKVNFAAGTYRFCVAADDGVRVEMDDQRPFIRQWHDGAGTYCANVYVTAGLHKVRVEYYEHTGQAIVRFWWGRLD